MVDDACIAQSNFSLSFSFDFIFLLLLFFFFLERKKERKYGQIENWHVEGE